jgi:hypothetical protein
MFTSFKKAAASPTRTTLLAATGNIIGTATSNRIGSCSTKSTATTCTWSAREHIQTCSSWGRARLMQPGTSASHAIGIRCSRLDWGRFRFSKHLGHPPPTSATPFRTGSTYSNRRTLFDSDIAARTSSSRFGPKRWKGFVNRPSFDP